MGAEDGMGMSRIDKSSVFAGGWLTVVFLWISYVMLAVEPGMGLRAPSDLLDPGKVAAGYASAAWAVSSLLYLSVPVAVVSIILPSRDESLRWSGLATSILWLVLGSIDRVGIALPDLVASREAALSSLAALLPVRLAILKTTIVTFGIFAWRATRLDHGVGLGSRLWRGLGWLVLALGGTAVFVLIPMPVVFAVWAIAFTIASVGSTGPRPSETIR